MVWGLLALPMGLETVSFGPAAAAAAAFHGLVAAAAAAHGLVAAGLMAKAAGLAAGGLVLASEYMSNST